MGKVYSNAASPALKHWHSLSYAMSLPLGVRFASTQEGGPDKDKPMVCAGLMESSCEQREAWSAFTWTVASVSWVGQCVQAQEPPQGWEMKCSPFSHQRQSPHAHERLMHPSLNTEDEVHWTPVQ